jgi:murein DD-endopeptidase MepM/ murein hydrolase activator NlpD
MSARVVMTSAAARLTMVLVAVGLACAGAAASVGFGSTSTASASGAVGASPPGVATPRRAPAVASRPPSRHRAEEHPSLPRAGPRWDWPTDPVPEVLRPFRAPTSAWGPGHRGLDLAAPAGVAVLAVERGVVTHADVIAGRGTVSVRHADGLVSTYEPVRSRVTFGEEVDAGDVLGVVAPGTPASHCGARICLHLGARRGQAYLDPWPLLAGGRLALLPIGTVAP